MRVFCGDAGAGGEDSGPHMGPTLKYSFDEGTGTTAFDSSGNELDADLSLAAWTAQGRNGAALQLAGGKPATDFVSVPAGSLQGAEAMTIAAWVKVAENAMWSRIFDFGTAGVGVDTRFMYLTPNTPEGLRFSFFGGAVEREVVLTTGTVLPVNVWKHVAVTLAANGDGSIYIDGFPAAKKAGPAVSPAEIEPLAAASWLGKSRFDPDPGFNGAIDEFAIYDRILSASEIASLASPKGDYTRLSFDEGVGTTSSDLSERAANATLEGGVTWSSGRLGAAAVLSGEAQFITLDNPLGGCTDELTVALWVKHTAAHNWARIFDFGGTNDNFMFLTPSTADGKLHLGIHPNPKTGPETMLTSATTIPANDTWHHVAVVVAPAVATLFVDGDPVGNVANPVTPAMLGPTNEHWLGKSRFVDIGDPYFSGAFDEVRISCRAFTSDEIRNLAFR